MIIGNKFTFAIEFHSFLEISPPLGRICYWIDGEIFGDIDLYSTLGLLSGGVDLQKKGAKLFLKKNLQQEILDDKDFEDISLQLVQGKPILYDYEYIVKSIVIEAAESFDGFEVYLFQNKELTTWIVAKDCLDKRYCCIKIDSNEVWKTFQCFTDYIHSLNKDLIDFMDVKSLLK